MPKLHALELVPDDAGREAVRRDWQALRDAGLPSQLDHTSPTNSPHVTLVSAPAIPDEAMRAIDALGWADVELTLAGVRRWDPDRGRVTTVVGSLS